MNLLFSSNVFSELFSQNFRKVFLIFISQQVMSDSSNSTNCVMSNSDYSSDGVVDKSKDEILFIFVNFKTVFYKIVHNLVCQGINFFISEQVMSDSSNSTDCVMSNSGYSSDGVVNKSKDEIFFSFFIAVFYQSICEFHGQIVGVQLTFLFIIAMMSRTHSN